MANEIPFNNNATQRERRKIIEETSSYHQFALSDEGPGGRFANQEKKSTTGAAPIPTYPALPANSPWHRDLVPPEPPLDIDVNAVEPVGTEAEIERSLSGPLAPDAETSSCPATVEDRPAHPLRRI